MRSEDWHPLRSARLRSAPLRLAPRGRPLRSASAEVGDFLTLLPPLIPLADPVRSTLEQSDRFVAVHVVASLCAGPSAIAGDELAVFERDLVRRVDAGREDRLELLG